MYSALPGASWAHKCSFSESRVRSYLCRHQAPIPTEITSGGSHTVVHNNQETVMVTNIQDAGCCGHQHAYKWSLQKKISCCIFCCDDTTGHINPAAPWSLHSLLFVLLGDKSSHWWQSDKNKKTTTANLMHRWQTNDLSQPHAMSSILGYTISSNWL